jgi:hypothetical protein
MKTCGDSGGRRANGLPCSSVIALSAAGLCLSHDPERAAMALEGRRAGGRAQGPARKARRRKRLAEGALEGTKNFSKDLRFVPENVPKAPTNTASAKEYARWLVDVTARGFMDAGTSREVKGALSAFTTISEKRELEKQVEELSELVLRLRADIAAAETRPRVMR